MADQYTASDKDVAAADSIEQTIQRQRQQQLELELQMLKIWRAQKYDRKEFHISDWLHDLRQAGVQATAAEARDFADCLYAPPEDDE